MIHYKFSHYCPHKSLRRERNLTHDKGQSHLQKNLDVGETRSNLTSLEDFKIGNDVSPPHFFYYYIEEANLVGVSNFEKHVVTLKNHETGKLNNGNSHPTTANPT